jgi:phosphoserine phosphatase
MILHFRSVFILLPLLLIAACTSDQQSKQQPARDPLASWNDGATKRAIVSFVQQVTDSSNKEFIPATDRIATFDNDGTLWAERPYIQELFCFYMVKKMVAAQPALAKQQPFKAVIEQDKNYFAKGGDKAMLQLMIATHTGMSQESFDAAVRDFFANAVYPGKKVPVAQMVYQPQLELLGYLRDNGFKVYICTGGTVDFVRGISWRFYGVPAEQVIGTRFRYAYSDSSNTLQRQAGIDLFNDKTNKPVGIQQVIGKRPVLACGNEGGAGDIAMLHYCQGSPYRSLQLIVNHNDSAREFYYQETDNASLNAAGKHNWHVISMQQDWNQVFPTGK